MTGAWHWQTVAMNPRQAILGQLFFSRDKEPETATLGGSSSVLSQGTRLLPDQT